MLKEWIITSKKFRKVLNMTTNKLRPIHAGEILREKLAITVDTAMRLARYFDTL